MARAELRDSRTLTAPGLRNPVAGRRSREGDPALLLVLAATVPLLNLLLVDSPIPLTTRFVGWLIWVACLVPVWQYFSQTAATRPPMPFLPVIALLYALYYARPLVFGNYNDHWRIRVDPRVDYDFPAQLALEGWLMLLTGWYFARPRMRRLRFSEYDFHRVRQVALFFAWLGPLAHLAQFSASLPLVVAGLAQFALNIGYFGIGLLMMMVAARRADLLVKATLITTSVILFSLQLASGFISQFLVTAALLLFSYWAVKGKLKPWLVVIAVLIAGTTFLLKSTLVDYRRIAWTSSDNMTNEDKLSLLASLAGKRVDKEGWAGAINSGSKSSASRSANMDLFADVVRRTPSRVPYWNGRTYLSLIGLAVPRVLWPTKPTKRLGQEFGHRYSLLDPHDTHTSFNMPFLIEFYANFGEIGIVVGMLIVGVIYGVLGRLINKPGQNAFITMMGIVLFLPLLNIESDFSLTFGGLVLNGFGLWFLKRLIESKRRASANVNVLQPASPGPGGRLAPRAALPNITR